MDKSDKAYAKYLLEHCFLTRDYMITLDKDLSSIDAIIKDMIDCKTSKDLEKQASILDNLITDVESTKVKPRYKKFIGDHPGYSTLAYEGFKDLYYLLKDHGAII